MSAAMLALAGLLPAACAGSPAAQPAPVTGPVSTTSSVPVSKTSPAPPVPRSRTSPPVASGTGHVLGPNGYGPVKLGMSFADARAAGLVRDGNAPSGSGCTAYDLHIAGAPDGAVSISADRGVEAIAPQRWVSTPEGLKIGADPELVSAIYPGFVLPRVDDGAGHGYAKVPGNARAVYRIGFQQGLVNRVGLQLADQKCFE